MSSLITPMKDKQHKVRVVFVDGTEVIYNADEFSFEYDGHVVGIIKHIDGKDNVIALVSAQHVKLVEELHSL